MNTIRSRFSNVQSRTIAVEYAAVTALITAFCVGAAKYGVVAALIAVLGVSVLTEVSAKLNVRFNPAANTAA